MKVKAEPDVEPGNGPGFILRLPDGKCGNCNHPEHGGECRQGDLFAGLCACPVRIFPSPVS